MPITAPIKVLKSVAVTEGSFVGNTLQCWPSVTGVLDLYNDVIFFGAFKGTLEKFLRDGFVPTDHQWLWSSIVAMPTLAEERGNKLYSECVFHSDQKSQDALTICKERLAAKKSAGLSIGFSMLGSGYINFDNGKALLAYAKKNGYDMSLFDVKGISACTEPCTGIIEIEELWEYSLTPVPANQQAMAIAVKSAPGVSLGIQNTRQDARLNNTQPANRPQHMRGKSMRLKTICGAHSLPLADSETWSAKDAESRLRAFAGVTDSPNEAYAKGFILVDGPNDEFTSYKMQFADVVDGKLSAMPKALLSAANVLGGIQSGGFDMTDETLESAKSFVDGYYLKMADVSTPWANAAVNVWKGQYLGSYIETDMCMSAVNAAWYSLYYEMSDAVSGYGDYGDMDDAGVYDCIGGMCDEFKGLSLSVIKAIREGTGESAETATLSVRRAIALNMQSLGDSLSYTKQAQLAAHAAVDLVERTKDRAARRQTKGRVLSEANRTTLKAHADALKEASTAIEQLLADTDPKASSEELRALQLQFLRLQVPDADAG